MFAPLWNDIYGEHETNNDILIGALILEFFVLTLQIADAGMMVQRGPCHQASRDLETNI